MDRCRLHVPSVADPNLPEGYGACLQCEAIINVDQLMTEICPNAPAEELVACDCVEAVHAQRKCQPHPKQKSRYRVRIAEGAEGLVELCAACYVNGHMWAYETVYRHMEVPRRKDGAA